MSLFLRAAARCDKGVASGAALPFDAERAIEAAAAEDAARREADAAAEAAAEDERRQGAGGDALDRLRREQTDERMERIRSDERRARSVAGRELASQRLAAEARGAGDAAEQTRIERNRAARAAAEARRLAEIEEGRHDALRREQAVIAERGQQRDRDIDAKIAQGDPAVLTAHERVRIDRERRRRVEAAMGITGTIADLYKEAPQPLPALPATGKRRGTARVTRMADGFEPLRRRHEAEAAALREEERLEEEAEEGEQATRRAVRLDAAQRTVALEQGRRAGAAAQGAQHRAAEEARRMKVHPIDVLQRQIARDLIDEREDEARESEEWGGLDPAGALDKYVDVETEAWRESEQVSRHRARVAAAG